MIHAPSYPILKRCLNFEVALAWTVKDANDEFFPDALEFADLGAKGAEYLERRAHRILQADGLHSWKLWVPKRNGMLREAMWLQPMHRVLYTACLHYFLPRLDAKLHRGVYSYRLDEPEDPSAYPFANRMNRWLDFQNDIRATALDEWANAILITDLASFFDHISCTQLCRRIEMMLGPSMSEDDKHVLGFLHRLLKMWCNDGFGIPQNMDASSFFGSLYLHPVDQEMGRARYRYFRWLDDIRIVAKSRIQALRALHDLQRYAQEHGLYLSSAKTRIVDKGSVEFSTMMDVEDDELLSRAATVHKAGDCRAMKVLAPDLLNRLRHHSTGDGNDRKFRAFANRMLDFGEFEPLAASVHRDVKGLVLDRLLAFPDRSDYWTKMLVACGFDDSVWATLTSLLVETPTIFDWQRFYLWRLILSTNGSVPEQLVERAIHILADEPCEAVLAVAILVVGKHGTNDDRDQVFRQHMTAQRSYIVQRATILAMQGLPVGQRDRFFERATEINAEHRELVEYLRLLPEPVYGGAKRRPNRVCREEPREVQDTFSRGIGLVRGEKIRFTLSRSDIDYE